MECSVAHSRWSEAFSSDQGWNLPLFLALDAPSASDTTAAATELCRGVTAQTRPRERSSHDIRPARLHFVGRRGGRTRTRRSRALKAVVGAMSLGTPTSLPPVGTAPGTAAGSPSSGAEIAGSTTEVEAYVAWTIHLHEEIHNYVRTYQAIFQLVAALITAGVAALSQAPNLRAPILMSAPFIVSLGLIQWATSLREIMTCAASIDAMEAETKKVTGKWILFHESAVALRPPNFLGSLLNNSLYVTIYAGSLVAGVITAYHELTRPYPLVYLLGNLLLASVILVNFFEVSRSRTVMRSSIKTVRETI